MPGFREIKESILHLFFPHVCCGCGNDLISRSSEICIRCMENLPETQFERYPGNPVEKIFSGRLPIVAGTAQYYFTRESLIQRLVHGFKYKGNRELGKQLGQMMGEQMAGSGRFRADALVPLPLFPQKEKKRGYNQATLLCEGMSVAMRIPVWTHVVTRPIHTETQTKKGRIERWKNMEGKFVVRDAAAIRDKHILLVDDVITTGATLEACGMALLEAGNTSLSIATLCLTSH